MHTATDPRPMPAARPPRRRHWTVGMETGLPHWHVKNPDGVLVFITPTNSAEALAHAQAVVTQLNLALVRKEVDRATADNPGYPVESLPPAVRPKPGAGERCEYCGQHKVFCRGDCR